MNTPKYSVNLHRNVSPLRSSNKPRYYSAEEVNKIVRSAFEPKIQFLMQQLQEKQKLIAKLNNKLNQNDEKLIEQRNTFQNYARKQKQSIQTQSAIVSTINQIINDKTKQYWQTILAQLTQISTKVKQQFDPKRLQAVIQNQMDRLKSTVNEFIQSFKKKSNSYWQKIKDALNKINTKILASQKDIIDVNMKIESFQSQRKQDYQTINQLQNSKNVVKNLIQLKKSVANIYENYQAVLNLQKGLKQKLEDRNSDSLWQEHEFFQSNDARFAPPSQDIVALQYSREDIPIEQQRYNELQNKDNTTQPMLSPLKGFPDKSSSDFMQFQKTTPKVSKQNGEHSQMFSLNTSQGVNSRIHNSTLLVNLSLQNRKQMCLGIRQRLLQMIEIKNLSRPLQIRYDQQINYLKSSQGNYLFDVKGNMFKINMAQLIKLEQEGIVARINKIKKHSHSSDKVKRSQC